MNGMLSAGKSASIDVPSTSGRCSGSYMVWAAPRRWCKQALHRLQAADVAQPAMSISNAKAPLLAAVGAADSLQQQQQQQQRQQQQPQQQRPRRLFSNGGNGTAEQQQQQQHRQHDWLHNGGSSSSSSPSSSTHSSVDYASSIDDADETSASERIASGSQASTSSSSSSSPSGTLPQSLQRPNRFGAADTQQPQQMQQQQLQQQPAHPLHAMQRQQQHHQTQQDLQQQQQLRAVRTVQWYREQANKRLTVKIHSTHDLGDLRQVLRQYEGTMNHIHINAVFCRLVNMVSSKALKPLEMLAYPALLQQVLGLVAAAVPDADERSISNTLRGLAVLDLHQERELISGLLSAAESLGLSNFTPQGIANTTWALATLHVHPGPRLTHQLLSASAALMGKFKPRELALLGWGVAVMKLRVPEAWVRAWREAVQKVLGHLNPQYMSMVLWAAARLWEYQEHSAQQQLLLQQQQQQQYFGGGGSSSSGVPAAAAAAPEEWLTAVVTAVRKQLASYTPHSVSICLWALARLGHQPNAQFMNKALHATKSHLRGATSPADLSVLLYSFAALQFCPSRPWLSEHAAALQQKAKRMTVREVSNVLWAHARLGVPPAEVQGLRPSSQVMPLLMRQLYFGMQDANARDLANSLWSLATLGYRPEKAWMGIFGAQAEALVHQFSPQEISNLLWAYAKLGLKPPHLLLVALWEGVGTVGSSSTGSGTGTSSSSSLNATDTSSNSSSSSASSRLSAFKPVELSMLLWALATLRVHPGKLWWEQFLQSSYHKMQAQTAQSLANIIWSLSELQLQPPPAWLYHWAAATRAHLQNMNPIDLGQVAAALQSPTFEPLGLPKLEALLLDVLDRLAALELQSGAYSKAAVALLMRMPQQSGDSNSSSRMRRRGRGGSAPGSNGVGAVVNDSDVTEVKQQLLLQVQQQPATAAATVPLSFDGQDLLNQDNLAAMAAAASATSEYGESAVQHL